MAIGKASDFKVYHQEFFGGFSEVLMQNAMAFNEASANCIRLVTRGTRGDYEKESFVKEISSFVTRRDTTSTASVTDLALTQDENVRVKINRKIGPVAQTLDAFRKIAADPSVFSFIFGQQSAKAVAVDMVNAACNALAAAIGNQSALKVDQSAATITHGHLATALSKMGDNARSIRCWVMHSKPWFDLMSQSITDKITNVADVTIVEGSVATLGRPVVITDSSNLVVSGTPDTYVTLGLVEGAAEINESETREIESEIVTGLENLVMRIQGEYAYNVGLRGFTWDVTNGGANPTDAAVGTGGNWDKVATDNRSLAGVYLINQ